MCFVRNINGNRDVKFLECDYLLVQQCVKLTSSKVLVHIFDTMSGFSYELSNKKYNCMSCDKVTLTVPI